MRDRVVKELARPLTVTIIVMNPSNERAKSMRPIDHEDILPCSPQNDGRYQIPTEKGTDQIGNLLRTPIGSLALEIGLTKRRIEQALGLKSHNRERSNISRRLARSRQIFAADQGIKVHNVNRHFCPSHQRNGLALR